MPLTVKERQAAHAVARQFYLSKEPTTRKQLLSEFKDPSLIDRLANAQVFMMDTSKGAPEYFPTILTFHHSGDGKFQNPAKAAVEVVIRDAKNAFMTHYDVSRRYDIPEFLARIESPNYVPVPDQITLGLFLAKDVPGTVSVALDDKRTGIISFSINEHILNQNPEKAWDTYVQTYDRIGQEDRQREATEQERRASAQTSVTPKHQSKSSTIALKNRNRDDISFRTAFNTYTIAQSSVGSGGAGTVHIVNDIDSVKYALKVLRSAAGTGKTKRFQNEILFCSKNSHENIITVLDHGITEGAQNEAVPFYVMPLYPTTLRKLMAKRIPPERVLPLFAQILDGLEAAHLKGVYHRDLKPENILCDPERNKVVLADFGIAKFQEDDLHTAVETSDHDRLANFQYSAPEQRVRGKNVTSAVDIFATGLILNEMFTGEIPQGAGYKRIAPLSPEHSYLDDIVDRMIQQTPEQRPETIGKIKEELLARGNLFVNMQRLDKLKGEVVLQSEVDDPLINDPIRLAEVLDYNNGSLTLRLNRPVNDVWKSCFMKRATRSSGNVSSAIVTFQGNKVRIIVSEHFLQQGVDFVKEYIPLANEEYASAVKEEHRKEFERQRAAVKAKITEEEKRSRILEQVRL